MKKIAIQILMCFVLLASCSEDPISLDGGFGTVKGRVVKAGTFEPLENVRISTTPTSSTFFSDKDGYFVYDKVAVGKYSFQATKEGYTDKFEPVIVTINNTSQIVFELDVSTANNKPPGIPLLTAPVDNVKNQNLTLNLEWTATDKELDSLTYTVTLKNGITDVVTTYSNIKTKILEISGLTYSTKYYWQVAVSDGINSPVNSVTNSFTTLAFPNPRFLYVKKVNNNYIIYTANDAGNELQLSASTVNSYRPRKNLQVNKIAYISSDGSQNQIYTMNPDGTGVFKVTNSIPIAGFNMENVSYCWSANGSQLIYPNFDKLYRINADGSGLVELFRTPNGKFISECDWSQDGNQIVLKVNDLTGYSVEIYVINKSGVVQYEVLSGLSGAVSGINFSTDNQRIVYTRDVSGYQDANYRRLDSRIFIYNRITNLSTQVDNQKPIGFNDLDVRFSPNEAEVIYTNTSNDGISDKSIQRTSINNSLTRTVVIPIGSMPDWR